MIASSGALSRLWASFRFDSAVTADRNSSFSSVGCWSCCLGEDESWSFFIVPVIMSRFSTVRDKVDITSAGFAFVFLRGVKMDANASSVTALGKLLVRDIGR